MIDNEGIAGHRMFIKRSAARLASDGDPDEEMVQLYSLRENLLYEDRNLAATHLNSAIHHLKSITRKPEYARDYRMAAIRSLNKAVEQLPMVSI